MTRYVSPINPAVFPHLSVVLLGIGVFFMAWFFVYPLWGKKKRVTLLEVFFTGFQMFITCNVDKDQKIGHAVRSSIFIALYLEDIRTKTILKMV